MAVMVTAELLASVAALSEDDRVALLDFIEQSLDSAIVPTAEQHAIVQQRIRQLRQDRESGLSKDAAIGAAHTLLA